MRNHLLSVSLLLLLVPLLRGEVTVFPNEVTLRGPYARQRLLMTETVDGQKQDRTRQATYTCVPATVASITPEGIIAPLANGEATITATYDGQTATMRVRVQAFESPPQVTFDRDIQPILTRYGCNSGPCHGKARGQNGFALSLLGYDPEFDYHAIVAEGKGRRVFPAAPEQSLLLQKGSGQVPHGGGKKLPTTDPNYDTLQRWLAAGMPRTPATTSPLQRITVEPAERLMGFQQEQQIIVTAHYADGTTHDVTAMTTFQSNDSVYAAVDAYGKIKSGPLPGEAAIMARYMEKFAVCNVLIPRPERIPAESYAKLPQHNFIDGHVWAKLKQLALMPSEPASDATFHRRVFLDLIGRLPTPDETRAYLSDPSPTKKAALVDRLLARPEYADWWANKWADLLRPNPYRVGIKAVYNLDAWLREQFRNNTAYDQFVRDLITAQGSTFRHGAAVMFRDRREPDEITTMVSQLFLGIRLECAKCHHHPFEVYGQDDFYSFAAYFARVGHKGTGISPPISGGEEIIYTRSTGVVKHPLSGKVLSPRPLFGAAPAVTDDSDPRRSLADWVTAQDNPFFAKVIVNRVWADMMGRGIVDPVDDLRATNPPSNAPLLDALAQDFRKNGYDLKKLLRTIALSYVYSLSTTPNKHNAGDLRNYSRHYRQRLRAEVLLDAISDITGVPESLNAMPTGSRAMQAWSARIPSVFLDSFGRPDPNQDPPCERTLDTSVVQTLHLLNAPNLHRKVTDDEALPTKLAAAKKEPAAIVEELYLRAYCRPPTPAEKTMALKRFAKAGTTPRQAAEDLLWAILNTPEFVFND